ISIYQADQMINALNPDAVAIAVADVAACYRTHSYDQALAIALAHARAVLEEGRIETNANIVTLKEVVRKMAEMPGQRTLILASPGFILLQDQHQDEGPAIDLAIRSGVVINALDVKGVRVRGQGPKAKLAWEADLATSGTLDDFASGTG